VTRISSLQALESHIREAIYVNELTPSLILVGGCSRSGKSTAVASLCRSFTLQGIENHIVQLDSWLIGINDRAVHSTVVQRYDCKQIVESVGSIVLGNPVAPPEYDAVSRRRISEAGATIRARGGLVFAEGVIALAIRELLELASLKIFVAIEGEARLERLRSFYHEKKGLSISEAEEIIRIREMEEVPFVQQTSQNADVIFELGS